jgi:hypothetical protein
MYSMALARHGSSKLYEKTRKELAASLEKETPSTAEISSLARKLADLRNLNMKQLTWGPTTIREDFDMDSFQNPELASAKPLDIDRQWLM